jgi:endonuclease/exonuclease/phosphatase family metal-dependent hydrolase
MQNLRRLIIVVCILLFQQGASAELVTISTWNLEWFPGRKPTSTQAMRAAHMASAQDALSSSQVDILCLQEVRDWESVRELVTALPGFSPHVVSRFQEVGGLGIQQTAIASRWNAEASWAEGFRTRRALARPPRGFSLAVFRRANVVLLVYSVHFKSNLGGIAQAILKREEAALQLLAHVSAMEKLYSAQGAKIVTVIAGDFNTDPTDPRFASEQTFALLRKTGFLWAWENIPLSERVTIPAKGRYPDASFDGFLVRGARVLSCEPIAVRDVSDHCPAVLSFEIN